MAFAPKPVKLTAASGNAPVEPALQPQPLLVYGGLPAATLAVAGGVKEAANVAAATGGSDTVTQTNLNNLITALKNAGIVAGP